MRSAELDGNLALRHLLTEAGYRNTTHAVAAHACYLHPATVAQAGKRAVLPVIRSGARRGRIDLTDDGRKVMLDDHRVSTWLFVRSTGVRTAPDVQVRHAWAAAGDPDANTALWNLHAVPGFLLDTLTGPERDAAADALRYRAWELYGRRPLGERKPCRPKGHKRLWFADQQAIDNVVARQAIQQMLLGEEIARTVLFLASDDSRMITKQSITVDGGLR